MDFHKGKKGCIFDLNFVASWSDGPAGGCEAGAAPAVSHLHPKKKSPGGGARTVARPRGTSFP